MKKYIILLCILVVVSVVIWQITNKNEPEKILDKPSVEEQEFNDSGRAKAIEDEKDLWMIYEDSDTGFSIKYPGDVEVNPEDRGAGLYINIGVIVDPDGPSFDFPVEGSEKNVGFKYVEGNIFMTLARFEVCDVTFERNLRIIKDNKQIDVVLKGDNEMLVVNNPDYFELNEENCGDNLIWIFDKQVDFFEQLEKKEGEIETQAWFDKFDKIVSTIQFSETKDYSAFIEGKWTSEDDEKSIVEFKDGTKKDIYDGEDLMEDSYVINGNDLIVGEGDESMKYEIITISETELEIIYLPRGNILRYSK